MIGIDVVKIQRMKKIIDKYGTKGLCKFLSKEEIALVKSEKTAAGFWAAKEACSKALQTGIGNECSFFDIIISKTNKGAPILSLSEQLIQRFNILNTSLSITHDGEYAIAVVALETFVSSSSNKIK